MEIVYVLELLLISAAKRLLNSSEMFVLMIARYNEIKLYKYDPNPTSRRHYHQFLYVPMYTGFPLTHSGFYTAYYIDILCFGLSYCEEGIQ
jgi:hypothetical protein